MWKISGEFIEHSSLVVWLAAVWPRPPQPHSLPDRPITAATFTFLLPRPGRLAVTSPPPHRHVVVNMTRNQKNYNLLEQPDTAADFTALYTKFLHPNMRKGTMKLSLF